MAATLLLLSAGCDPTVDSFDVNEKDYSLFGFLNASSDTQFIRVEPLRDSMLVRAPVSLNATVTLTHLGTERTTSLQDSLFLFLDEANAHNFYTTVDIEPTASYQLVIRGPDGAVSRAQTTVPDTFPSPTVLIPAYAATCDTDLARTPTPSVSGDLAGYLQSMPGIVSVGDQGGQLFIRGGRRIKISS